MFKIINNIYQSFIFAELEALYFIGVGILLGAGLEQVMNWFRDKLKI